MGKRIDELPLDDTPIDAPDPDDRAAPWSRFLDEIDDLLQTGQFTWAEDTLNGIYDSVRQKRWVTEGQKTAVRNIAAARSEDRPRRGVWRRRYEGGR